MAGRIHHKGLIWLGMMWLVAAVSPAADWTNRCRPIDGSEGTEGLAAKKRAKPWISWQLQEENDFLAIPGSDEFYSQGLLLTLQRDPDAIPRSVRGIARWLGQRFLTDRESCLVFGVELGQHIFSPEDLARSELISDDRPYAGYLYGGVVFTLTERAEKNPIQHIFELQLGLVGPESGAEWTQTEIHQLTSSQEPLGWDNQLPFEPGLELIYRWRRKLGGKTADVVPHWGGALGSFQIYANAGATFRWGKNLSDFPVLINRTTVFPGKEDEGRKKWEAYLFAGADGRLVGHNIFLDGTVFSDSHSVDKESFVFDLQAGFSVRRKHLRLSYTLVRRSREFSPLPAGRDDGEHDFGSVSFTMERAF